VQAAERLKAAGIKGIRYLDQGSRAAGNQPAEVAQFTTGKNAGKWKVRATTGEVAGPFNSQDEAQTFLDTNFRKSTSNFVVFDDEIIDIMKKYGVALPVAAAMKAQAEQSRQQPKVSQR
jgi:hypothetical protein